MAIHRDKALHSLRVASYMEDATRRRGFTEDFAKEMFMLGWVHDIGYNLIQLGESPAGHAKLGGEFLKDAGYQYWEEVATHGNPYVENPKYPWYCLNEADMHINSKGEYVSYEERLSDIKERYGTDSEQYNNAKLVVEILIMSGYTDN